MAKRITENHAFMKKIQELVIKMEELGITIECGCGGLNIVDDSTTQFYRIRDIDTKEHQQMFPPSIEFMLTFDE